jgi:hypothetical protein
MVKTTSAQPFRLIWRLVGEGASRQFIGGSFAESFEDCRKASGRVRLVGLISSENAALRRSEYAVGEELTLGVVVRPSAVVRQHRSAKKQKGRAMVSL